MIKIGVLPWDAGRYAIDEAVQRITGHAEQNDRLEDLMDALALRIVGTWSEKSFEEIKEQIRLRGRYRRGEIEARPKGED